LEWGVILITDLKRLTQGFCPHPNKRTKTKSTYLTNQKAREKEKHDEACAKRRVSTQTRFELARPKPLDLKIIQV
jgi:hypothetical protein